ncbi:MAG: DUF2797 domain-containing protein [Gammaproteobacteria bacterium]|nr:DUF2797 domain-containing protein [Gammaproteobacteria bacterium]
MQGNLRKMAVATGQFLSYQMRFDDQLLEMNPLLGRELQLTFKGRINCIACDRKISKSFNQGYCWPCSQRLAVCDICIVRPEKRHYDQGTCRQPEWGLSHCMQPHVIYLANTSGLKIGITRESQIPTRWIDQGATQALPILRVPSRYHSGLVEITLALEISDKTNWQRMLKGPPPLIDLVSERNRLRATMATEINHAVAELNGDVEWLECTETRLNYPVTDYPQKVNALNFDKQPEIGGQLLGIKGQYLIMDAGVVNIRKFAGYHISMDTK